MANLIDIQAAQKNLEDCFVKKMNELQAQLQISGTAKDTVAKVAEEFRTFRELIFNMLGLLRQQIKECSRTVDAIETRQRRKALIFSGVPEGERESCSSVILDILLKKMHVKDVSPNSIKVCHRLGSSTDHSRPILVRFVSMDVKSAVWRAKTALKGSNISVKEFLTKTRQTVFGRARMHFGMRGCWTQDGTIYIKTSDGNRHKVSSIDELLPLLEKYPKVPTTATTKTVQSRKT